MIKLSKVTAKGQVTIPVEVRKDLGIAIGDTILFEKTNSHIVVCLMKCRSVGVSGMFLRIISGTLIQIIKKVSKGESKETLPGWGKKF